MLESRYPIMQAAMGGASPPELVAAVSNAGGIGSLAAAYLSPAQIEAAIAQVRSLTVRPFSVNLFVFETAPLEVDAAPALALLTPFFAELGLAPPQVPAVPAESFQAQAAAVLAAEVPMVSFTFGIPVPELIAAFRARGTEVAGTATSVREAVAFAAAGADGIIGQGGEAGAHRGTFLGRFEDAMVSTLTLVPQIRRAVSLPIYAAGGIMNGAGIKAVLGLGADIAVLGTAFLACPESGIPHCYREALMAAADDGTTITRAFSGRPARGLRNRMLEAGSAHPEAILPFPWQNALTRPMRNAAAKLGRPEFLSLWAGQGAGLAREMPAAELVALLAREAGF